MLQARARPTPGSCTSAGAGRSAAHVRWVAACWPDGRRHPGRSDRRRRLPSDLRHLPGGAFRPTLSRSALRWHCRRRARSHHLALRSGESTRRPAGANWLPRHAAPDSLAPPPSPSTTTSSYSSRARRPSTSSTRSSRGRSTRTPCTIPSTAPPRPTSPRPSRRRCRGSATRAAPASPSGLATYSSSLLTGGTRSDALKISPISPSLSRDQPESVPISMQRASRPSDEASLTS